MYIGVAMNSLTRPTNVLSVYAILYLEGRCCSYFAADALRSHTAITRFAEDNMRRIALTVILGMAAIATVVTPALSQTPPAQDPRFDVASIKLNLDCVTKPKSGQAVSPGRLNLECITLREAIENAYGVWANAAKPNIKHPDVRGGPEWVNSDHYAIVATADGNPTIGQMSGPMLRALLEERFKLSLHRESRDVPVYALTVAKSGLKAKRTQEGRCFPADLDRVPPAPPPGEPLLVVCGRPIPAPKGRNVTFDVFGVSIADFADGLLSRVLDRTVIDKTGLPGLFDLHFEFTPDDATPLGGQAPVPPSGQLGLSIFTALEEQLGLKLESAKGPVDVLLVDSVQRPTEN